MPTFGPCPLCGEMHDIPDSRSFDRSQMGCDRHMSEFPSGWGTPTETNGTIGSTEALIGPLGGYDGSPLEHKVAVLEKVLGVWIARAIELEAKVIILEAKIVSLEADARWDKAGVAR